MKFSVTTKKTSFFAPDEPVTKEYQLVPEELVVEDLGNGHNVHVFVRGTHSIDLSLYDRSLRISPHKTLNPIPQEGVGELKLNDVGFFNSVQVTVRTHGRER